MAEKEASGSLTDDECEKQISDPEAIHSDASSESMEEDNRANPEATLTLASGVQPQTIATEEPKPDSLLTPAAGVSTEQTDDKIPEIPQSGGNKSESKKRKRKRNRKKTGNSEATGSDSKPKNPCDLSIEEKPEDGKLPEDTQTSTNIGEHQKLDSGDESKVGEKVAPDSSDIRTTPESGSHLQELDETLCASAEPIRQTDGLLGEKDIPETGVGAEEIDTASEELDQKDPVESKEGLLQSGSSESLEDKNRQKVKDDSPATVEKDSCSGGPEEISERIESEDCTASNIIQNPPLSDSNDSQSEPKLTQASSMEPSSPEYYPESTTEEKSTSADSFSSEVKEPQSSGCKDSSSSDRGTSDFSAASLATDNNSELNSDSSKSLARTASSRPSALEKQDSTISDPRSLDSYDSFGTEEPSEHSPQATTSSESAATGKGKEERKESSNSDLGSLSSPPSGSSRTMPESFESGRGSCPTQTSSRTDESEGEVAAEVAVEVEEQVAVEMEPELEPVINPFYPAPQEDPDVAEEIVLEVIPPAPILEVENPPPEPGRRENLPRDAPDQQRDAAAGNRDAGGVFGGCVNWPYRDSEPYFVFKICVVVVIFILVILLIYYILDYLGLLGKGKAVKVRGWQHS